jgi:hypothetical protein
MGFAIGGSVFWGVFGPNNAIPGSHYPGQSAKNQSQQARDHAAGKAATLDRAERGQSHENQEGKSEFWAAKLTDWLLAVFTFFLVLFTYRLWKSTDNLWVASKEQFELARQEFIATHRPRVIVRFIQGPFHEDDRRFIFITFVNIGDSEALVKAIGADLAIWRIGGKDGGHWDPPGLEATPVDLEPGVRLASGQRHTIKVVSRSTWGDAEIWADTNDQIQTVAQGAIEYRDGNGVLRETGFSRILDKFGTFHFSKNPEEEYQD